MIICVTGFAGCGKNVVSDVVAQRLGIGRVKLSFKDIAKDMGISLMDVQQRADKDPSIDREFDNRVSDAAHKGDCVVSTWLGPWLIRDASMRVWLDAGEEVRARRISNRDKITYIDALKHVKARDENNRKRYFALYGINIDDHSAFDLIINTEIYRPEQSAGIIIAALKEKKVIQ